MPLLKLSIFKPATRFGVLVMIAFLAACSGENDVVRDASEPTLEIVEAEGESTTALRRFKPAESVPNASRFLTEDESCVYTQRPRQDSYYEGANIIRNSAFYLGIAREIPPSNFRFIGPSFDLNRPAPVELDFQLPMPFKGSFARLLQVRCISDDFVAMVISYYAERSRNLLFFIHYPTHTAYFSREVYGINRSNVHFFDSVKVPGGALVMIQDDPETLRNGVVQNQSQKILWVTEDTPHGFLLESVPREIGFSHGFLLSRETLFMLTRADDLTAEDALWSLDLAALRKKIEQVVSGK